jgi:hypothetical protein
MPRSSGRRVICSLSTREINALALTAIAEGGIVDEYTGHRLEPLWADCRAKGNPGRGDGLGLRLLVSLSRQRPMRVRGVLIPSVRIPGTVSGFTLNS